MSWQDKLFRQYPATGQSGRINKRHGSRDDWPQTRRSGNSGVVAGPSTDCGAPASSRIWTFGGV